MLLTTFLISSMWVRLDCERNLGLSTVLWLGKVNIMCEHLIGHPAKFIWVQFTVNEILFQVTRLSYHTPLIGPAIQNCSYAYVAITNLLYLKYFECSMSQVSALEVTVSHSSTSISRHQNSCWIANDNRCNGAPRVVCIYSYTSGNLRSF